MKTLSYKKREMLISNVFYNDMPWYILFLLWMNIIHNYWCQVFFSLWSALVCFWIYITILTLIYLLFFSVERLWHNSILQKVCTFSLYSQCSLLSTFSVLQAHSITLYGAYLILDPLCSNWETLIYEVLKLNNFLYAAFLSFHTT